MLNTNGDHQNDDDPMIADLGRRAEERDAQRRREEEERQQAGKTRLVRILGC